MKKLAAMMLALLMVLASVGIAEEVPFSEWLAGQDPVVTDVFAGEAPAPEVPTPEAPAPEAPAFEPIGVGSRGETVAQLQAKLIELGILDSKADGIFGAASEAAVKYTQKALGWEETGVIQTADELNTILALVPGDGVNLAVGTSDEWSEWITPEYNVENQCFTVAYAYIEDQQIGDVFSSQVEIEFSNVTATIDKQENFSFGAQGSVDGAWNAWNIWNNSLVKLDSAPEDGVYKYIGLSGITETNLNSLQFNLGFRCDYWASGSFRVRRVKVEKGRFATEWSKSERDIGDGINIAIGTSSEWSEWMTPVINMENQCFGVAFMYPGERRIGDTYSCQVEIEFVDVSANPDEGKHFGFNAQGAVDDTWDIENIWNSKLVRLSEIPDNGVYKFTSTSVISDRNVDSVKFNIGFRCDNWNSGSFRVRCVKVERGTTCTEWTPAVG